MISPSPSYGDRGRGDFKTFKTDHPTDIAGRIADTCGRINQKHIDSLVPPFNLGREALFEGVAKGRCKTAPSFKIVPRTAEAARLDLRVVWKNG